MRDHPPQSTHRLFCVLGVANAPPPRCCFAGPSTPEDALVVGLPLLGHYTVSGSFSLPRRGSFRLSSRYGSPLSVSQGICSGGWSPYSNRIPCPALLIELTAHALFVCGAVTHQYRAPFQTLPQHMLIPGSGPLIRSPLLGNLPVDFFFLGV